MPLHQPPRSRLRVAFLPFAFWVGTLSAAERAPTRPPYAPPSANFPESRVGLLEAVRLTLQHDPSIKIQETSRDLQKGILQELRGSFDGTLSGNLDYQYLQQELRRSVVKAEQDRRDSFQKVADETGPIADKAEAALRALQAARAGAPGTQVGDPVIQAQLDIIDELIRTARDDNERQAYIALRNRTLDRYIQAVGEIVAQFRGQYLDALNNKARLGPLPEIDYQSLATLHVEYAKLLRSGISLGPFADGSFERNNYKGKRIPSDEGGKGIEDLYKVVVGFKVDLPLARGRGSASAAAPERAAEIDYHASLLALKHQASRSVLFTTVAYWDVRAAGERVDVVSKTVALRSKLVEYSRALIRAGEIPRTELSRILASETDARARLDEAQRDLSEQRVNLARVMGLALDDESKAPAASDDFPVAPEAATLASLKPASLTREAVERRNDRKAALSLQESGKILARAARLDQRPLVHVGVTGSYSAVSEQDFRDAIDRWVGPSATFALTFEKPMGNNFFEGRRVQRDALLRQRTISAVDLDRNIRLNVVLVLRSLQIAVERLQKAQEAVKYYQETIDAEVEKFRHGQSTLVDTILTEEQKTGALLALVSTKQQYARLLAQLRFETGVLVSEAAGQSYVDEKSLLTVPGLRPEAPKQP